MLQSIFLNFSLNFFITFIFFQLFVQYENYLNSPFIRKIFLGICFGIAQFTYISFPLYTSYSSLPIIIGGTTFITAAVFGGGIASSIASVIPYLAETLIYGRWPFESLSFARIVIGNMIILTSFSVLPWKRWKIWLLLNIVFQIYLLLTSPDPKIASTIAFIRPSIEITCSAIIYYLVLHLFHANSAKKTLEQYAITDNLTGLHNVRSFNQNFHKLFSNAQNDKSALTLIIVDIDFFKNVNDNYGHLAGDQVLIEIAHILKETFQNKGFISRNGGEEFSVLLAKIPKEKAIELARQLRQNVEQHSFLIEQHATHLHLTVSVGVVCYSNNYITPEQFWTSADEALYRAKRNGRNQVCLN